MLPTVATGRGAKECRGRRLASGESAKGGCRKRSDDDRKALCPRPQTRPPLRRRSGKPQSPRRGAPVARRDPCQGKSPVPTYPNGCREGRRPFAGSRGAAPGGFQGQRPWWGPGVKPLAGCQGSALTGSPEGGALWRLGHSTFFPQQVLYFLPLPQGQGSLRPTFSEAFTLRGSRGASPATRASTGLAACTRSGVRSTRAW